MVLRGISYVHWCCCPRSWSKRACKVTVHRLEETGRRIYASLRGIGTLYADFDRRVVVTVDNIGFDRTEYGIQC
jgi:hypothetical protein